MTVVFENDQWMVTNLGISARPGHQTYQIAAHQLLERANRGATQYYDWPLQMAGKQWVNINDFNNAFIQALEIHADKYDGELDQDMLTQTLELSRGIAARA